MTTKYRAGSEKLTIDRKNGFWRETRVHGREAGTANTRRL